MAEEVGLTGLGMQVVIYKSQTDIIRVNHITSFPDIGGTPQTIDSTNKDNQKYQSSIQGLQPLPTLEFGFVAPPLSNDGKDLISRLQGLDRDASYDIDLNNPNGNAKNSGRAQVSVRRNANTNDDLQTGTLSLVLSRLSDDIFFEAFQLFYDANGGKGPLPIDLGWYEASDNVTVLDGAGLWFGNDVFAEWNTSKDGTGTTFAPGAVLNLTQNMTLYAQFGTPTPPGP